MKWKLGLYRGYIGDIVFYLGIHGTQHRVRLYPPFGYSILEGIISYWVEPPEKHHSDEL